MELAWRAYCEGATPKRLRTYAASRRSRRARCCPLCWPVRCAGATTKPHRTSAGQRRPVRCAGATTRRRCRSGRDWRWWRQKAVPGSPGPCRPWHRLRNSPGRLPETSLPPHARLRHRWLHERREGALAHCCLHAQKRLQTPFALASGEPGARPRAAPRSHAASRKKMGGGPGQGRRPVPPLAV